MRLSKRKLKWLLVAFTAFVSTLGAMVVSKRSLGDPNLATVTIISGSIAWIVIGIYQASGKFRIGSLLLLCTLVALIISWSIPILRQSAANRRLMAKANAEGGKARVLNYRLDKQQGWMKLSSQVAIPEIFEPVAKIFFPSQLHCELLPVDQIDLEIAQHARLADHHSATLLFRGQPYDELAVRRLVRKFCNEGDGNRLLTFELWSLSQQDFSFMESLATSLQPLILDLNVSAFPVHPSHDELESYFQTKANCLVVTGASLDDDHWSEEAGETIASRNLIFQNCNIGPSFVRFLRQSKKPMLLSFRYCTVSAEALDELAKADIEGLSVINCGRVDSLLVHLQYQTNLHQLHLFGTFDAAALSELANVQSLRSFRIEPQPASDVIRKFIKNNPKLENIMGLRPEEFARELEELETVDALRR